MRYIYIHGFNSGRESRSGTALEKLLGQPVLRAQNDYSLPFRECMEKLLEFISTETQPDEKLCLMGTSLGGFYALQLRHQGIAKVAAWNPVLFPALQLARFTGENTRFTDGQKWIFGRDALLSYAVAPDPRVWDNFYWTRLDGEIPKRMIFLGDHDDVLDHEVTEEFWAGHAPIQTISSGHSIENFDHALDFLK